MNGLFIMKIFNLLNAKNNLEKLFCWEQIFSFEVLIMNKLYIIYGKKLMNWDENILSFAKNRCLMCKILEINDLYRNMEQSKFIINW